MVRTKSVRVEGDCQGAVFPSPPDPVKINPGSAGTERGADRKSSQSKSSSQIKSTTDRAKPQAALARSYTVTSGRETIGLIRQSDGEFTAVTLPDRLVLGVFRTVKAAFGAFRAVPRGRP